MSKLDQAIRRGNEAIELLAAIVAAERQVDQGFAEIGGAAFLKACERSEAEIKRAALWLEANSCPE